MAETFLVKAEKEDKSLSQETILDKGYLFHVLFPFLRAIGRSKSVKISPLEESGSALESWLC